MDNIFLLHLFTTFFMTGLCVFVQVIHYPLFKYISVKDLPVYERKNLKTAYITAPIMFVELFSGLYLWWFSTEIIYTINSSLLCLIWLSTFIFQGQIHLKICNEPTEFLVHKLIMTNWIRTISWFLRSALLIYILSVKF